MKSSTDERLCLQWASDPQKSGHHTTADRPPPTAPDLRMVLPQASQGHSAFVHLASSGSRFFVSDKPRPFRRRNSTA